MPARSSQRRPRFWSCSPPQKRRGCIGGATPTAHEAQMANSHSRQHATISLKSTLQSQQHRDGHRLIRCDPTSAWQWTRCNSATATQLNSEESTSGGSAESGPARNREIRRSA
eukprot:Amastigsp_a679424_13.p6 type:complete len:113 gc:universal Amastigsp_a679424_13:602-264(-)